MNFANSRDAVHEDPLDTGFQGHHRQRAATAGTDHLDVDDSVIGPEKDDVAAIGLDGRANVFEGLLQPLLVYGTGLFGTRSNVYWR